MGQQGPAPAGCARDRRSGIHPRSCGRNSQFRLGPAPLRGHGSRAPARRGGLRDYLDPIVDDWSIAVRGHRAPGTSAAGRRPPAGGATAVGLAALTRNISWGCCRTFDGRCGTGRFLEDPAVAATASPPRLRCRRPPPFRPLVHRCLQRRGQGGRSPGSRGHAAITTALHTGRSTGRAASSALRTAKPGPSFATPCSGKADSEGP